MFNCLTYSHFNIKIGKTSKAKLLQASPDTFSHDILCVPIFLQVPFWEVRDIHIILRSNDIEIDSELFDGRARSWGNNTLDWSINRAFACICSIQGKYVTLGGPVIYKDLQGQTSIPVKLEVWKDTKLISFACYTLSIVDGKASLSDREGDKSMPKQKNIRDKPLTKKRFEGLLTKAAQPLLGKKSAPKETETEVVRPSDDCSDRCMSQDKTEGKED